MLSPFLQIQRPLQTVWRRNLQPDEGLLYPDCQPLGYEQTRNRKGKQGVVALLSVFEGSSQPTTVACLFDERLSVVQRFHNVCLFVALFFHSETLIPLLQSHMRHEASVILKLIELGDRA